MDKALMLGIMNGGIKATIGKYVKDGANLDWVLDVTTFNTLTGVENEVKEHHTISLDDLNSEINKLIEELELYQAFKTYLEKDTVPTMGDLS
jgi:hypothetical protein